MRLLSLILALLIIGGLITYYKDSMLPGDKRSDTTVKQQAREIIDEAKKTTEDMQKQLEQQNRRFEELEKK